MSELSTATDLFSPASAGELSRFVAENAVGARRPLYPVGGRTALGFGYAPTPGGVDVSTAKLARVLDYPARDMTVTVETGVPFDQLVATLHAEGQQLPIDVAQSHRATIGGIVATNTGGPRRFGYGTWRDYVIGISAVDGRGRLFQAGGRVVKNVAGYDLCKLLIGSLGTLAVITQVTFKLRPIPQARAVLWTTFDGFDRLDAAAAALLTSSARPVVVTVLSADAAREVTVEARVDLPGASPVLLIGVEGGQREVDWQAAVLHEELSAFRARSIETLPDDQARTLYAAVTEFPVCTEEPLVFKANLPPSASAAFMDEAASLGVSAIANGGGAMVLGKLPDEIVSAEKAAGILTPLRRLARASHGNLVVLDCRAEWKPQLPLFGEPEQAWPLMERIKRAFDPHRVLNAGRMFPARDTGKGRRL